MDDLKKRIDKLEISIRTLINSVAIGKLCEVCGSDNVHFLYTPEKLIDGYICYECGTMKTFYVNGE